MAKKRFDFITVGGAVRDIMYKVLPEDFTKERNKLAFKLGQKIYSEEVNLNLGGGAANVSVALAKLGFKVATVMRLGADDDGEAVKKQLQKNRIDTRFVQIDDNLATGFSFIAMPQVKAKDKQYVAFLHRGANENLELASWFNRMVKPRWLYVSSLPAKNWLKIMDSLELVVKRRKSKLAWNPGKQQLAQPKMMKKYLPIVEVLILNKEEASLLYSGLKGKMVMSVKALLSGLHKFGPKLVVITSGSKGADAYNGYDYYFQKALSSKAVDTTGVGDAFGAGLVVGLKFYDHDLTQALYLAAKNSASVIMKPGAQNGLLTLKDIR